jgi:chemotaxis protein methyltransferase CheR
VNDADCLHFLRWALPRLQLRWQGFRKVRRQVCRRVEGRVRELDLADLDAYRAHLASQPDEWSTLDGLCRITISRFRRDRGVFDLLEREVLPELAALAQQRDEPALEAWSAGCASGEEPYSLALLWALVLESSFPELALRVLATDTDESMLARAVEARYGASSLKELPPDWRDRGFVPDDGLFQLRPELARFVSFARHDVRTPPPGGPFHLVLCRNLAFTYFDADLQNSVRARLEESLHDGGALVVGTHEQLSESDTLTAWAPGQPVYRNVER